MSVAGAHPSLHSHVLVACPDEGVRTRLGRDLGGLWRVDLARGTAQGLASARTRPPRLVVCSDLALVLAIRGDLRIGQTPILFLLASGDDVDAEIRALESGADAVLPCPVAPARLHAWAHRLVQTRQRLRERWSRRAVLPLAWEAGDSEEVAFLEHVRIATEAGMVHPAFSVGDLAYALHVSPRQLTRRLKAHTGEAPGAMIRRLRMGRAAHLLAEGHPVAQVAEAVGFRSRSQFREAFQAAHGVSPSDYAPDAPRPAT